MRWRRLNERLCSHQVSALAKSCNLPFATERSRSSLPERFRLRCPSFRPFSRRRVRVFASVRRDARTSEMSIRKATVGFAQDFCDGMHMAAGWSVYHRCPQLANLWQPKEEVGRSKARNLDVCTDHELAPDIRQVRDAQLSQAPDTPSR